MSPHIKFPPEFFGVRFIMGLWRIDVSFIFIAEQKKPLIFDSPYISLSDMERDWGILLYMLLISFTTNMNRRVLQEPLRYQYHPFI